MPSERTTKSQVQAYRFGMRRLGLAVSSGESYRRTLGGPRHGLSYLVGFLIAALTLGGFAVYGLIRPAPSIGTAKVVVDSDSGGAYVVRGGRLYPALNLSSALLAAGQADAANGAAGGAKPSVRAIDGATLAHMPKGQLLGISGAPNQLPAESALVNDNWTVCDTSTVDASQAPSHPPAVSTTVLLGTPIRTADEVGNVAALVTPDGGITTYLLWSGRRSLVEPSDREVALALGTDGLSPRPISLGLLNAIPEGAAQKVPPILGVGQPVSWSDTVTIGSVFTVRLSAGTADYVALPDGVQRITPLVADLIRASTPGGTTPPQLSPSALSTAPATRSPITLTDYPSSQPRFYNDLAKAPVICLAWAGGPGGGSYAVYPLGALPLPAKARAVPAPPGTAADAADAVYVAPGHGAVIGQVTGNQQAKAGALFLVTDEGVRYPVVSLAALAQLGLAKTVSPAAPSLVTLLPSGPTLDPAVAGAFFDAGSSH